MLFVILAFEHSILMILEIKLISTAKKKPEAIVMYLDKPSAVQSSRENTHSSMQIFRRAVTIRATLAS